MKRILSLAQAAGFATLAALAATAPLGAQAVTLDEGVFRVLSNGREVGMETFSIRRSGSGDNAVTIANGRVVLTGGGMDEELTSSLEVTGPALRPAAYQIEVLGEDAQRIFARVRGGRFSARIMSSEGERMREYVAGDGAVVLDDGVAHHYYFLGGRASGPDFQVPILVPRQSRQVSATVSAAGSESLEIGGRSVQARRVTIQPGDGPTRHMWLDAEGRVLRLTVPELGYEAIRTVLP